MSKKNKQRPLCRCGCGNSVKWNKEFKRWNVYLRGHNLKTVEGKQKTLEANRKRWGDPTERFWSRVDKSGGPDACWLWTGSITYGYGRVFWKGTLWGAHRVAWELGMGKKIPEGMYILHHCDNRRCCNPKHLFLGTQKDNMQDAVSKGRAIRGETSGRAKLTADGVREIRKLYEETAVTRKELAGRFGIGPGAISSVVHRRTWKHIK